MIFLTGLNYYSNPFSLLLCLIQYQWKSVKYILRMETGMWYEISRSNIQTPKLMYIFSKLVSPEKYKSNSIAFGTGY